MIYTGRVFDIVEESNLVAKIVLRKKIADKFVMVAISVFGFWKDKILLEKKLKKKDKIRATLYLKSRIYNGKYYTDVYFKEVDIVESYNPSVITDPNQAQVFTNFDQETGEVFD
jgi:hypothetical protein